MNKSRSSAALTLAFIMVLMLLAGCSSSSKTSTDSSSSPQASVTPQASDAAQSTPAPEAKEVTLKVLFPGDPPKDLDAVNAALAKKMKADGLNFKLEYTFVPWDAYWNKQSLVVAAGEEYDLTWSHISMLPGSVAKKVLLPLDDAIKSNAPDLQKATPDYVWKSVTINKQIFAIPRLVPSSDSTSFQIRGDLRKKYGVPEIKTIADFEKYLDAIKKNEPAMVPNETGGSGILRELAPSYYGDGGWSTFYYIDVNQKPLKFKNFFESDVYTQYVTKMREWYNKGYLPKDPSVVKDATGDFDSGKSGVDFSVVMRPTEQVDPLKKNVPNAEMEFVFLNPDKPKYMYYTSDNLMAVLATSKHVKEAVAFINWTRKSQENYDMFSYGVKDVNYKLDGNSISYDGIPAEKQYQPINWAWTDIRYNRVSKFITNEQLDVIKNWDKDAVQTPLIGFTLNSEPVKSELAKVTAVMGEYKKPLEGGIVDFSTVRDKFLSRLKDAGIDTVLAEYQKQLDAYLALQK